MRSPSALSLLLILNLIACDGEAGAAGPTGPEGPAGPQGAAGPAGAPAPDGRIAIHLPGATFYPEGMAVSSDGTFYVGSVGTGAIARVPPHALGAVPFVEGKAAFGVYGMEVDAAHNTLWACTYDDNLAPAQPAYLTGYSLATGMQVASFKLPGDNGGCNDVALDPAGNVYATDSFANAIVRLPLGGSALQTWSTSALYEVEPGNFSLTGIAYDGAQGLYVVNYTTNKLIHVPIQADGSAGTAVDVPVTPALDGPDGLELVDTHTLLAVENPAGQASLVRLADGKGAKAVLANGYTEPTAAAVYQGSAWVLEGQLSYLFGAPGRPSLPFRAYRVALP
ncbi:hypothetical protein FGE12_07290 [Aggregicoccus sp. 17bor-14]|uniref:hypothetical protein n=1 Tax=Myxococcaceae TaxID=31 RepID=UPI00129D0508|nr:MULTISPECIES: hypothetical protein [Myxococcaceae]MBF5042196.1 hypothetical protein [Simulacricoccus sp. 17bor-14]MRI87972.1 hypothetical protein [Aggregicoccus sp. 17bor-14]